MVARLNFIDLVYNEHGLEDVLYQLARLMFGESLAHGEGEKSCIRSHFPSFHYIFVLQTDELIPKRCVYLKTVFFFKKVVNTIFVFV